MPATETDKLEIVATDKLDTVHETAELFNCSPATVWRRVADGTIPKPIKIGGMTRFFRKENLAVIEKAKLERAAA